MGKPLTFFYSAEGLLLKQEDIYGMKECKIPVWASFKMFQHRRMAFCNPRTGIFQRRASY
jgi:hypothetical protein